MRKGILAACFIIVSTTTASAFKVSLGLQYGLRTVADSKIKNVYGSGTIYFPSIRLGIFKRLELGAGYEGGYKRNGEIGLYGEKTSLEVTGVEGFAGYCYRLKILEPYVRLGVGYYAYKQTIESEFVPFQVDHKKLSPSFAAGLRVYPFAGAHVSLEAKFVPLKVKPIDEEVNLGGLRLSMGVGYSFDLF